MKWKNYNIEEGLYFVTTVLRDFTPLFEKRDVVAIALDSLDFMRRKRGLKIYAYVIMPDHIHLVVSTDATDISTIVGHFKRYTSRLIARYLKGADPALFERLKANAYKGQNYSVWQETFRAVVISDNDILEQKVNYIHDNPVRRGLVKDPSEWEHSSFHQIAGHGDMTRPAFLVDTFVSA